MTGFETRPLGKTGLMVSPLGIGGGSGISGEDLLYAFDRGVNYFFSSSDLHHFSYARSAAALRKLCGSGSAVRDRVVLATVSYVNDPEKLMGALFDQFAELEVDYIDVFHWGWLTDRTDCPSLLRSVSQLKEPGILSQSLRAMLGQVKEVNRELVRQGLVRYVGASFHSRTTARQCISELEVLMLRYNLAHRGIEEEVIPFLSGEKTVDPGLVAFNVAHQGSRFFNQPPPGWPKDLYVPTVPDCYRFALSHPAVDLVLTGVSSRKELDEALTALEQGPFSPAELAYLREYGSLFR